jgi:hypothetical protein
VPDPAIGPQRGIRRHLRRRMHPHILCKHHNSLFPNSRVPQTVNYTISACAGKARAAA